VRRFVQSVRNAMKTGELTVQEWGQRRKDSQVDEMREVKYELQRGAISRRVDMEVRPYPPY